MAYTPTAWVNNTPPPLSAANLNKLTDELEAQAFTYSVPHSLPNWADGVAPALTDAAPWNEMERVTAAVAAARGSSYAPTVWLAGWNPSRNAARLNRLESQVAANSIPLTGLGDRYAAPNGSDSALGTLAAPYLTVGKLLQSLLPGETGMLRAGTYGNYTTWHGDPTNNGTSSNRITLTNYPGEKATIVGYFTPNKNYWTFSNLYFNTTNINFHPAGSQAIDFSGNNCILEYCDIYQDNANTKGNLLLVGAGAYDNDGAGDNNIIRYNRIHDGGAPEHQRQDHNIYFKDGNNIQIYGNWMWNNPAGWGVQIYPGPSNALIHSNVIDRVASGFVFSGDTGYSCLNNTAYNNVVINSTGLSFTGGCIMSGTTYPPISGNVLRDNCGFNNPGGIRGELEGATWCADVAVSGNIIADTNLQNVASHDYRPTASTPAAVQAYGLPTFVVGPTV